MCILTVKILVAVTGAAKLLRSTSALIAAAARNRLVFNLRSTLKQIHYMTYLNYVFSIHTPSYTNWI